MQLRKNILMKQSYIKPNTFCIDNPDNEFSNNEDFIQFQKKHYEERLRSLDLTIRMATMEDRDQIMALRNERFTVPNSYTTHWFYHLFNYGSCILIENTDHELVGYKFEATYMDEFKTSFTAGTAVKISYNGLGLGKLLIGYSHLVAMEKGAKVNRGIIDIINYSSVYNFINHFGGVFIDFEPNFRNYGARLIYQIPLDQQTPNNRSIDFEKVEKFIASHQSSKDFYILKCDDIKKISHLYQNTSFRIIALLPKKFMDLSTEHYLLTPF